MLKPKVYFRCDANSGIGMGHLIRCTALAEMIESSFEITFITKTTPLTIVENFLPNYFNRIEIKEEHINFLKKGDIIVIDGYNFNSEYQSEIKKSGAKVVFIDDLVSFNYKVDVIINQAENVKESDYSVSGHTKFYLGPKYVLLRPPFLQVAKQERNLSKIESVFVSFGGADLDNVSYKIIKTLVKFSQLKTINVLTSSVNKNVESWKKEFPNVKFHSDLNAEAVCSLMECCELAISPCSNLALELCAVGLVLIGGTTADNQENYYKALTANSSILGMGKWQEVKEEDLYNKITAALIYDEKDIAWFIRNQRNYIDGLSGKRLLEVFLNLAA